MPLVDSVWTGTLGPSERAPEWGEQRRGEHTCFSRALSVALGFCPVCLCHPFVNSNYKMKSSRENLGKRTSTVKPDFLLVGVAFLSKRRSHLSRGRLENYTRSSVCNCVACVQWIALLRNWKWIWNLSSLFGNSLVRKTHLGSHPNNYKNTNRDDNGHSKRSPCLRDRRLCKSRCYPFPPGVRPECWPFL